MRLVRYTSDGPSQWGVQDKNRIYPIDELEVSAPTIQKFASKGYRTSLERAISAGATSAVELNDVNLLAPVESPGKIVCVGLNYHDHAEEQDEEIPEKPMLFSKASTSITHPERPIIHPADVSQVDYEVELAFVVGKTAKHVAEEDALDYVAGFTVMNDVSARDAQFDDGQFFRGKSYDTFAPMGPALVTGDDLNPNHLSLELRVNGETKQSSTTGEFIFTIEELVAYLSRMMTLEPGDVVTTGTPGGVGIFRDPPDLLEPGDEVVAEIEGIGALENHVVADPAE